MPIWERYDGEDTLVNVGDHGNSLIFHNEEDTDNFQSADVVIVDGIMTVVTDTDDLIGVRMLILPEVMTTADFNEDTPAPHDRGVYYSWYVGRGPLVFRLRAKRTIYAEHKLWLNTWKARGTSSTKVRWGLHAFLHLKH